MSATVLIVQPDLELAERMGQLILAGTPHAAVGFVQTVQEGISGLSQYEDLDLCICELYFPEGDGLALLSAVRARFRHARIVIVTAYNLQNFADHLQGLTLFPLPLDETAFSVICQDSLATLEGLAFPPFRIGKKQPPDRWGDCFAAYDTGVKRAVFLTVLRANASPDEARRFRLAATTMARASHPNVQAVYQAGNCQGRDFFAREKWDMPNLAEMATAGQSIDARLAAQIIHIIGSVVIFWDANDHPHTVVGATDVSVSPQGVIKVANCVDPTRPVTPPGVSDLTGLAHAVLALLPDIGQVPPRVRALLTRLGNGPVPLAEVISEAQAIDIDLAPEREIEETEEHHEAQRAIELERKRQQVSFYLMCGGFALVLLFLGYLIYDHFFAEPPSRQFNEMVEIRAGPYVYQSSPAVMNHTFYIDKYEVTLGQYLKFLRAVQQAGTDAAWRSPDQNGEKNHEPNDWVTILQCIRYHEPYHKDLITLDFPAFNIDWFDAEAYAKWAGKRLPDEHEWEMAARGPNGNLFPWGNTFEPYANTSVLAPGAPEDNRPAATHLIVDQNPQDKSPYGVMDMAGNVSEWTGSIVPSPSMETEKVAVIRGGSFLTRSLEHEELTRRNLEFSRVSRFVWLGFRCARDTPPPAK